MALPGLVQNHHIRGDFGLTDEGFGDCTGKRGCGYAPMDDKCISK